MSESSKTSVSEVQAENEFEPRKLMQAILATHIGDSTLGVAHQMFMITQRYNNLVMGQHDNLSMYYINTKSALTAIQQAYEMAGRGALDETYPEGQMAVKFIMGLNNNYGEFRSFFTNGLKPWPDCLETAYQEAAKYNPKRAAYNSPAATERANAFAMTGREGRGGRGGYPGGHKGKALRTRNGCETDQTLPKEAAAARKDLRWQLHTPPTNTHQRGTREVHAITVGNTGTWLGNAEQMQQTQWCSTGARKEERALEGNRLHHLGRESKSFI